MLDADKINLGGKTIEFINDQFCVNGVPLKQIILNEIIEDYRGLKKLHKYLKGEESKFFKTLNKHFSFAEQLEALLEAFEGNRSKLNRILEKAKEIRIRAGE